VVVNINTQSRSHENRVDRTSYGERAAASLWRDGENSLYVTEELVTQAHDVTLFASGDSLTSAKLVLCCTRAQRLDPSVRDPIPYYMLMFAKVREMASHFDVLHFHIDQFHFPLFSGRSSPTVQPCTATRICRI
jgi:hypothetical protein